MDAHGHSETTPKSGVAVPEQLRWCPAAKGNPGKNSLLNSDLQGAAANGGAGLGTGADRASLCLLKSDR